MMAWLRRRRVTVRPMTTADADLLDQVFAGMSPESRRNRYLAAHDRLPSLVRAALVAVDGERHVAFVAVVRRGRREVPIGIARYVVDAPGEAEVAYEVVDAWQGCGVGRLLLRRLVAAARAAGLERLHTTSLDDNIASIGLLRGELPAVRVRRDGSLLHASAQIGSELSVADVLEELR